MGVVHLKVYQNTLRIWPCGWCNSNGFYFMQKIEHPFQNMISKFILMVYVCTNICNISDQRTHNCNRNITCNQFESKMWSLIWRIHEDRYLYSYLPYLSLVLWNNIYFYCITKIYILNSICVLQNGHPCNKSVSNISSDNIFNYIYFLELKRLSDVSI